MKNKRFATILPFLLVLATIAFFSFRYWRAQQLLPEVLDLYNNHTYSATSSVQDSRFKQLLVQLIHNHVATEVTRLNHPNGNAVVYALPFDATKPRDACGLEGQKFCFLVMEHPLGDRSIVTIFQTIQEGQNNESFYTAGNPELLEITHVDGHDNGKRGGWIKPSEYISYILPTRKNTIEGERWEEKTSYMVHVGDNVPDARLSLLTHQSPNGDFSIVFRPAAPIIPKYAGNDGIWITGNLEDDTMTVSYLAMSMGEAVRKTQTYPMAPWPIITPEWRARAGGSPIEAEIIGQGAKINSYY